MRQFRLHFTEAELRQILETELAIHPQSRLVDIYKLLNQAHFGPTHINPDPGEIARNIRLELNSIGEHEGDFQQDIGCGRGFVRVNLISLVTFPTLPFARFSSFSDYVQERFRQVPKREIDNLTRAILASRYTSRISPQTWKKTWQAALPLVLERIAALPGELQQVEELSKNDVIPSHSETYRELYVPHYRVIHHSLCAGQHKQEPAQEENL